MGDDLSSLDIPKLRKTLLEGLKSHLDAYPEHLEDQFPRLFAKLVEFWGTDFFDPYIDSLIFSNRPDRQGFPAEVGFELFRLKNAHEALGLSKPQPATPWESGDDSDLKRRDS